MYDEYGLWHTHETIVTLLSCTERTMENGAEVRVAGLSEL